MQHLLKLRPAASLKTHLFTAAMLWSLVGSFLMVRGYRLYDLEARVYILAALAFGTVKSLFLLDKSAKKNIRRILDYKDGKCLGGVYSVKMWVMIALMVVLGRFLRVSALPSAAVGILYMAVGWALFLSSRLIWRKWGESL